MKKLVVLLLMFGSILTFAQNPKKKMSSEEAVEKRLEKMSEALDLTPDQQAKLKDLFLAQAQKQKEAKAEKEAFREQVKAVLTPEQQEKMKEMNLERREKIKDRMKQRRQKNTSE